MSLMKERLYMFLEEVTAFITVTIKDLQLSDAQTKDRDNLMDNTRSLQDMVNNSSLSGWSDLGDELDSDSNGHAGGEIGMVPAIKLMPSYCGWLLKKRKAGGIKSNLAPQKRWCCLKQCVFYYYTTDMSDKQQGSFLLDGYNAEQMFVKKSNLWIRLSRPGYRTYEFQASDETDLQKWLDALARETTQSQTQGSSPTNLARRTLPPLPGPMLLPGQMLPPCNLSNQHHFVPEPDMYDDTDIPPTVTDDEGEDSYDDVDPAAGPPFIPPRPEPLSELKGPPQLPVRPGKQGRDQGNISKSPPRRDQPNIQRGPTLPSRPKPGQTTPPVLPEAQRPPTPPRRPGRVVSDIYEPVSPPPEGDSDSDSDSYDDAISELVRPQRLNNLRTGTDSGFSSQASDWSNASFRSDGSMGDGPSIPPIKKSLPPTPTNTTSRPQQPIPQSPQSDLQAQLKKKLQNPNQGKPSQGKPKPSFYKKLYVAQFDYTSDQPDELELRRGDLIKIIDKQFDRQRWWTGSKEGKTGLVPKTYLTEVYKSE